MIFLLTVVLVIVVAVVLHFVRKERLWREYLVMLERSSREGGEASGEGFRVLRDYVLTGSLRNGIVATAIGAALLLFIDPGPFGFCGPSSDGPWSFFGSVGVIVLAYGIGSLLVYALVDKPRLR
ncbi:MAG: DUF6249 domain-containing protein [Candidatus Eisenbacteria bacterium]